MPLFFHRIPLVLILLFAYANLAHAAPPIPGSAATEIHAALQGMDDAWNAHDMKAFVAYMTDDVEWVNVVGMRWRGKDEVYRAHAAYHQTIFKNRKMNPPESVDLRALAPDAIIVTIVARSDGYTTPSGHVEPPGSSVLTEVFVQRNGHWLLAEGHNTTIVESAQRSNPIQH